MDSIKISNIPGLLSIIIILFFFTTACKMNESSTYSRSYKKIEPLQTMRDLDYPYEVKYAQLGEDIELAYADEGQGKYTLIFIHGLGSYLKAWYQNIEGLKSHYRCIALDLPGYGKSSKIPHSGMMSFYAEVIKSLIDKLELQHVILAGHSMGGQIAMMAAINYPETIEGLILVDPAGFEQFTEGQKKWFREVMTVEGVMKTTIEQIQTNAAFNFYRMPDDARFMITDRIAMRSADDFENYCYSVVRSVNGMVDEPVYDMLDQIKQPVLIFFGENDNLIPNRFLNPGRTSDVALAGHERLSNSKLIMVPKCGHFMQLEKPKVFNASVKEFLAK
jgi:pimeloyl-ACP methyl ester carboxylesterase